MDPKSAVFPDFVYGFNVEDETTMMFYVPSPDLSFMDMPFVSPNPEPVTFTPYGSVGSTEEVLCSTTMGLRPEGDREYTVGSKRPTGSPRH